VKTKTAQSRLGNGERISGISAILLFAFTFFHWYGVKAVNTSNLLFAIQAGGPGKSAWEALDYAPIFLLLTVVVTLAVVALRLANASKRPRVPLNAVVMILGIASVLLILYRIVDPPIFSVETTITIEGAAQLPIYLALFAATGMACGGCAAIREEGISSRSQHAHGGSNSTMSV
jgi:uncharacterized membrane protein